MAKTKAELLEEANKLGIEVDEKAKVAEIKALIDGSSVKEESTTEEEPPVAKAGKRSAKSIKEAEEKLAKEERKSGDQPAETAKKTPAKPVRTRLERRAKGYRKSAGHIERGKAYGLPEAVKLAKSTSHVKFDATVELHVNLGVDPKQADQNVRDTLLLPAGTGKTVKIAVFTDNPAAAKQAGADLAGTDEITAPLEKGAIDFDILIATPKLMPQLGKYARVLGPRGLMPNPKSGTVTDDIERAVAEAKAGRVEYRVDSTGIVHLGVGKVSFNEQQLLDNINAVAASLKNNKPGSVKGTYIKRIYLTTSMGPSITVDPASVA